MAVQQNKKSPSKRMHPFPTSSPGPALAVEPTTG